MGHYDTMYEEDHANAVRERVDKLKRFETSLVQFTKDIPTEVPKRFLENLEDLHNWVKRRI